jgi:hypothetical protein
LFAFEWRDPVELIRSSMRRDTMTLVRPSTGGIVGGRRSKEGGMMRTGAALMAGMALILLSTGSWRQGESRAMAQGGQEGELLSWTIPLASENPAAAAALGNVAATSAKRSMHARPAGWGSGAQERDLVEGGRGGRGVEDHRREDDRRERRRDYDDRDHDRGYGERSDERRGSLKVRDCATWSRYCQEQLAKEWLDRRNSHDDEEMQQQRPRLSDNRRFGSQRDERAYPERGSRRDEENDGDRREEGREHGEERRREAEGDRRGERWGRQERTIDWPRRGARAEEEEGTANRGQEGSRGFVGGRQQQQQQQPSLHASSTSPDQEAAQQGAGYNHEEESKKKLLGIQHFTMPHLPAETAVWVANQVADRANGFVKNPGAPAVTDVDAKAKKAYKQGTDMVVLRRQDEGFFPRPLGEDWAAKQRAMQRSNAVLDSNIRLTKPGAEMADIVREHRQRVATIPPQADVRKAQAIERVKAKHASESEIALVSRAEALKRAIAEVERQEQAHPSQR